MFAYPPQIIPVRFRWQNYVDIFTVGQFARQYLNSLYIAALTVAGTLLRLGAGGYALARLRFPGPSARAARCCCRRCCCRTRS